MKNLSVGDINTSKEGFDVTVSFLGDGDLNFDVLDLPSANIIDLFQQSNDFCHRHFSILFKCQAGMSRSCSFLIAYLIGVDSMSLKDALSFCKSIRPQMNINSGFMFQLQLFESMNGKLDIWNSQYRRFKSWVSLKNREQSRLTLNDFGEDPEHLSVLPNLPLIKCKKCRRKLAIFIKDCDHQKCNGNILIEPMQWMIVEQVQGKLHCPRCECKIGSYLWQGRSCKCGYFMAPYFTFSPNKVDIIRNQPDMS
eukprot:NODE_147_length_17537_cov_0.265627.p5 type:complete len:252 gc:universal NODE_147_length_17537_cov_0.265627:8565-7810(-)